MYDVLRELFKDELEDAYESGRTEGRQEGRIEGIVEGRQEEISRLRELYRKVASEGRHEELLQALSNPEIIEKLYEEFGLV